MRVEWASILSMSEAGGRTPSPIVITHGWPSSIYEMTKIIPLLTDPAGHGGDPADSFDVVAPSLPGYGFSDPTSHRGINTMRTADLWTKIMTEGLGYQRFCAHGGDWGAAVTTCLGVRLPGASNGHSSHNGLCHPDSPGTRSRRVVHAGVGSHP